MLERIRQRLPLIRPMLLPFVIYIALLAVSTTLLQSQPDSPWRLVFALLPLLPTPFIMTGLLKAISRLDELEQRHLREGIIISFSATFIITLTFSLLEQADFPQLDMMYIPLMMALLWLGGKIWSQRKYQ